MITNAQLVNVTYDQAENWFHQGFITADQWAGFRTAWRRSAPHLSSLGSECEGPQAPEVEAIAAEIKAAYDAQRAAPRTPASFGFPTNI